MFPRGHLPVSDGDHDEPRRKPEINTKQNIIPEENGGVAQLGEHLPCKQGVKGSIPFISTKAREARSEKRREKNEEVRKGIRAHSSAG